MKLKSKAHVELLAVVLLIFTLSPTSALSSEESLLTSLQRELNFHSDYWGLLKLAVEYAKCMVKEREHPLALDPSSLIMKPSSCKVPDCGNCTAITKEAPLEKIINFTGFHNDERAPAPVPKFHCTSHNNLHKGIVDPKILRTHFRIEYPTPNLQPPVSVRDEELPRIFVVEKEVNGIWAKSHLQSYWFFPIETRSPNKYRVRVTAVSPERVYYPQTSELVTIYDSYTQNVPIPQNLRVVEQTITKVVRPHPQVTLRWESGSGLNASCDFDIFYLSDDEEKQERTKGDEAFWATLHNVKFGENYEINVIEKFGYGKESTPAKIPVKVKTCLEFENFNIDICPPPPAKNVRVENESTSSFWLAWDQVPETTGSTLQYHITIAGSAPHSDSKIFIKEIKEIFRITVPGNQTRIEVMKTPEFEGKDFLQIHINATSSAGKSTETLVEYKLKVDPPWTKGLEKLWIALVVLVLLVMSIMGIFYLKSFRDRVHRNREQKEKWRRWEEEAPIPQVDRYFSKYEIDFGNLELHDVVGRGEFGEVRKAILHGKQGKMIVAVKTFKTPPSSLVEDSDTEQYENVSAAPADKLFREEFEILKGIEPHLHVVGLVGIVKEPIPALVVEFCDGGDLKSHLHKAAPVKVDKRRLQTPSMNSTVHLQPNGKEVQVKLNMVVNAAYFAKDENEIILTPQDLLSYARQIACGMEFLSSNKIIHRDLAARNILISGKNRILKIADFGLSRDVYCMNLYKKKSKGIVPVKWLAIECIMREVYTTKSDVWSYGILLWEIVTFGATPYPGIENSKMFDVLKEGYRMRRPDNCSVELYDLMRRCWEESPIDRPDFTEIRKKIEQLIVNSGDANYLNLDNSGSIEYSELIQPPDSD